MSPYVIIFCFLAASVRGAVLTKEAEESVVVGADAKQHLMRKEAHDELVAQPDDSKDASKDSKDDTTNSKSDTSAKDADTADSNSGDKAASKGPVSISLYYETRCPDCIMFINQTLEPLWRNKDLVGKLNITMNPYGNSMSIPVKNVSEGYKFFHPKTTGDGWEYVHICQHGSDECMGNLVQACAIKKVEEKKYMELVFCMAGKPDWGIEKSSYECMTTAGIDPKPIKECVESPQGNQMMSEFGKKTGAVPGRQGTPWVMIEGVNLVNVTDLLRTTCKQLGNGPNTCLGFAKEKPAAEAPSPAAQGDDGTFTVLPVIKQRVKKNLVQISLNKPKIV